MRLSLAGRVAVALSLLALTAPAAAEANLTEPTSAAGRPTVTYAPCPNYPRAAGCFDEATNTVFVAERGDRETLAHELGHVFDRAKLTDRDHRWFARIVGMAGRAWQRPAAPGEEARESPEERFADLYAACTLGVRPHSGQMMLTGYGLVISGGARGRYRRGCTAIAVIDLTREGTRP